MMIELTADESAMLADLLESLRSDLRMEIVDTEDQPFREELKIKERLLARLVQNLQGPPE